MGIKTRFSHATGSPLMFRLAIYYHEQTLVNGIKKDRYNYVYDWFEKPGKQGLQPSFDYYEKKLMEFFLGDNLAHMKGKTIKRACVMPNTGEQKVIREYTYRNLLEHTFRRVIKFNCQNSMQVVYRYFYLIAEGGPTAFHIASTLLHYFETLDWSKSDYQRVHEFFINGKAKVALEAEKLV